MKTKFNFNSAICTSKVQSERLLALGLKKETADMCWHKMDRYSAWEEDTNSYEEWVTEILPIVPSNIDESLIPAWSLHRMLSMLPSYVQIETYKCGRKYIAALDLELDAHLNVIYKEGVEEPCFDQYFYINDAYESVCRAIEWLIKEGYFNKEYLCEKN